MFISDSSSIEAYVDSGASSHVVATANISVFSRVRSVITNLFGIGGTVKCTHRGTYGSMENAIHAPASNTNLFSVAPETDKGYIALFSSTGFHLFPASAVRTVGKPVRSGIRVGNCTLQLFQNMISLCLISTMKMQLHVLNHAVVLVLPLLCIVRLTMLNLF